MSYGGYGGPSGGYPAGGYGGGYGGPSGGYPAGGYPPASPPPPNYLWQNILGIFGCTVVGIIGLVFALQVHSKWQMGDYAGAESASNTAKILGIIGLVGFILTVLVIVGYIIFFVVMLGTMATYSTY